MKRNALIAVLLISLTGCGLSSAGSAPTSSPTTGDQDLTSLLPPSPTPTPEAKPISEDRLRAAMVKAAERALKVYTTIPVGHRESRLITGIARDLSDATRCTGVIIPPFPSPYDAGRFAFSAIRGYGMQRYIIRSATVVSPKVVAYIERVIEANFGAKVTVQRARITTAVIVGGCTIV